MSTTCADVYASARAFSPRTPVEIPSTYEILSRIRADQRVLFAEIADTACERFQTTASVTSSSGSSARTIDVSALTPPLGRVLTLTLTATGYPATQVDVQDQDSKFAPRYIARGLSLVEVGSDWSASTGTVSATLAYVQGPTDITPTGAMTQAVSVPDEWVDLLVLPLVQYLQAKDPSPSADDVQRVAALLQQRRQAFAQYLVGYAGEVVHAPAHRKES